MELKAKLLDKTIDILAYRERSPIETEYRLYCMGYYVSLDEVTLKEAGFSYHELLKYLKENPFTDLEIYTKSMKAPLVSSKGLYVKLVTRRLCQNGKFSITLIMDDSRIR